MAGRISRHSATGYMPLPSDDIESDSNASNLDTFAITRRYLVLLFAHCFFIGYLMCTIGRRGDLAGFGYQDSRKLELLSCARVPAWLVAVGLNNASSPRHKDSA
ncbi:hypothetical protein V1523DRAFT_398582 [Lipomyces doorenjongii]